MKGMLKMPITGPDQKPLTMRQVESIVKVIWNLRSDLGFCAQKFFIDLDFNILVEGRRVLLIATYSRVELMQSMQSNNLSVNDFLEDVVDCVVLIANESGVKIHFNIFDGSGPRVTDRYSPNQEYLM